MDFKLFLVLLVLTKGIYCASKSGGNLQPHMPNVCAEQQLMQVAQRQPYVQVFTRMVKVWKQGCSGKAWCAGHQRRTAYYTAYRQVYRQEYHTVYKCCPGWSQLNGEAGCLYPLCSYGVCFNGGQCREGSIQLCECPAGFRGPSCQYVGHRCSVKAGATIEKLPITKGNLASGYGCTTHQFTGREYTFVKDPKSTFFGN
ncbi:multiple epidermal growth factor-like domains protein 6 [Arapaima gigas]